MDNSRRSFLTVLVPGAALAGVALMSAQEQQSKPTRPPNPGANPGGTPNQSAYQQDQQQQQQQNQPPGALPETPRLTPAERKAILTDDQKQIKKDVEELYGLAQDLKTQSEKMDSTAVLSIQFVQKTEEIEKLARKIRGLARG
ncbi:MAG TPA: hypothetical protein VJN21_04440 [Candidatus Acidoferrales bacterium]|nr:hypothetical protein [Candidatus Acidoferrales bacterium]